MKEKIVLFIKNHKISIALVFAWIVAFILGFAGEKTEAAGGLMILALFWITIIYLIVSRKKKKAQKDTTVQYKAQPQLRGIEFPQIFENNGKTYEQRYYYDFVEIVGSDYCGNVPLVYGEPINVVQEPTNQVDQEAVMMVVLRNGQTVKIGYLPRNNRLKKMVNDFYRRGGTVLAAVDNPAAYTMSIAYYYEKK